MISRPVGLGGEGIPSGRKGQTLFTYRTPSGPEGSSGR